MTQPLIDRVLTDARTVIADRKRRLRCREAVTADGTDCDPYAAEAVRFCAVGALIHSVFELTGDHERAHKLGWKIADMIANAGNLRRVDESDGGWALALVNDTRGQYVLCGRRLRISMQFGYVWRTTSSSASVHKARRFPAQLPSAKFAARRSSRITAARLGRD